MEMWRASVLRKEEENVFYADSVAAFALNLFYHEVPAFFSSSHTGCRWHFLPL